MVPQSGFGVCQLALFQKPQAWFGIWIRAKEKPNRQCGCSRSVLEDERFRAGERSQDIWFVSTKTGVVSRGCCACSLKTLLLQTGMGCMFLDR